MTKEDHLVAWKKQLDGLKEDIADLWVRKDLFNRLQAISRKNPAISNPGHFLMWMARNYADAECSGIRRMVDKRSGTRSITRLLESIQRNHDAVSLERMRTVHSNMDATRLNRYLQPMFRGKSCLDPDVVREDLVALEAITAKVKKYTDHRIAHEGEAFEIETPRFDDIHRAIKHIEDLLFKYRELLTGEHWIPLEGAAWGTAPEKVFEKAWLIRKEGRT